MMEATVAIGAESDGIGDLVGAPIGQHLHVMHFEKRRAVGVEKRRLIGARFAETLGVGQNPSSDPWIARERRLGNLDPSGSLPTCRFSHVPAREQLPSGAIELRFVCSGCQLVRASDYRQYTFTMAY